MKGVEWRLGRLRPAMPALALVAGASAVALAAAAIVVRQTAAQPAAPARPQVSGPVTATVSVNAGTDLGKLNNPAWYHNDAGPSGLDSKALGRVQELNPKVTRVWIKPDQYYDKASGRYTFDYVDDHGSVYQYLDQVSDYSQEIMVNLDQCHQSLMDPRDPDTCRDVLKNGLRHYKQRYPNIRYVELFNEPDKDWQPTEVERPGMPVDKYYAWYKVGYAVVNELNDELGPRVRLRIGGPVTYTLNEKYFTDFLKRYQKDGEQAKRLDFVSYHQYKKRDNPAAVEGEKKTVQKWLDRYGVDRDTPVFVTEYGVFPGANQGTTFAEDLLTHAAAMATLGYYFVRGGLDMAMHWVFDHDSNDRKSMLVDNVDGAVYPYYNLARMQRMLRETRIRAESDALSEEGIGVHALATKDSGSVAVLVTNYQWTDGATRHVVTMKVSDLPPAFQGKRIQVERYLVDARTSNYAADPSRADLHPLERYVLPAQSIVDPKFELGRNAMSLVVLTPVT